MSCNSHLHVQGMYQAAQTDLTVLGFNTERGYQIFLNPYNSCLLSKAALVYMWPVLLLFRACNGLFFYNKACPVVLLELYHQTCSHSLSGRIISNSLFKDRLDHVEAIFLEEFHVGSSKPHSTEHVEMQSSSPEQSRGTFGCSFSSPCNRKYIGTCVHHDEEEYSTQIKTR